jgi:serine/threonine protein phosphatase PrpC
MELLGIELDRPQTSYTLHGSGSCTCKNWKLISHSEEQGKRPSYDDRFRIIPVLDEDSTLAKCSFIGIYDGHGRPDIVNYLEYSLEKEIANELKETKKFKTALTR